MAEPTTDAADTAFVGTPGVPIFGGWLFDERNPALAGRNLAKTLRQMRENHHLISRAVSLYAETIASVEWRVEPASVDGEPPTDGALEAHRLVQEAVKNLPLSDIVQELLDSACTFGVGLYETSYKRDGDSWTWDTWEVRRVDTIDQWFTSRPDGGGDFLGVFQRTNTTQAYIPAERLVRVLASGGGGSPMGRSAIRGIYDAWRIQQAILRIAGIGLERSLAGLPLCTVPSAVYNDATKRLPYDRLVSQIRVNEAAGVVFPAENDSQGNPTGFKLSLMAINGNKGDSPLPLIQYLESSISVGLSVQFLLLGAGGSGGTVGSFSLADSHTDQLARSLGRMRDRVVTALNVEAKRLQYLNGFHAKDHAKITAGDLESPNLAELGAFVDVLSRAGVNLSDRNTQEHLRALGGIPAADASDATL